MNVQKRRKTKQSKTQRSARKTKSAKKPQDLIGILKSAAITAFIWGLVIVNLFLIASFITGKISTGSKNATARAEDFPQTEAAPASEPVAETPATPVQPSNKIEVEVLNGCNVSGLAAQVTEYLRIKGFDVVYTGNYVSFEIDRTTIIDRRSLNLENAQKVAEALGVTSPGSVFALESDEKELHVSVILGSDYKKLKGIKKPEK
ncbi:LytR C-terminal domain-containing protein [candidate division KSB1 bacterium]|nr:LytR C-terminal domain-containing protein [candidate division KSB1 bacterium]